MILLRGGAALVLGVSLSVPSLCAQTWVGNGADAKLSNASNWLNSTLPAADQTVTFTAAGTSGTLLNWDVVTALNLEFASGASAYTFEGGPMSWSGTSSSIRNSSTNLQTFNIAINRAGNGTLDAAGGALRFNSSLSVVQISGSSRSGNLTVKGTGGVTFSQTATVDTARLVVNQNGNLTLGGSVTVDSATSAGDASNGAGVLNVGAGVGGGNGILNIESTGVLDVKGNTSATKQSSIIGSSGNTGEVNVYGSLVIDANSGFIIGNSGNGSTGSTGSLNIYAGVVTINKGTTTTTGSGPDTTVVMMGRDNNTASGTINLNGGVLATGRQFVRDGSTSNGAGAAYFNFNGGTLKALSTQTDWLRSSATGAFLALTAVTVNTGGATIDSNGFDVAIHSNLLNGGGGGGLTKQGVGTLTLGGANAYTGATTVSGGTLAITGSIASSAVYSIAAGAVLDVSAKNGYSLTGISTTIYLSEVAAGFIEAGGGGALTLGSSALTLNFDSSDLGAGVSYDLFNAGSTSGNFGSVSIAGSFSTSLVRTGNTWTGVSGLYAFNFDQSTGDLSVTASAIPEPSTYAAIAGAFVLGAVAWRRRKSRV